jgi:hypothetical protein
VLDSPTASPARLGSGGCSDQNCNPIAGRFAARLEFPHGPSASSLQESPTASPARLGSGTSSNQNSNPSAAPLAGGISFPNRASASFLVKPQTSSGARTARGSTVTVNGSAISEKEGTPAPAAASAQTRSTITTRSGRVVRQLVPIEPVVKKQVAAHPVVKKQRGPSLASNFENVVLPSAAYQALLAESRAARTPQELATAEMKLWNVRHRYAPEGSNSPNALNLQHLRNFVERKLGPEKPRRSPVEGDDAGPPIAQKEGQGLASGGTSGGKNPVTTCEKGGCTLANGI